MKNILLCTSDPMLIKNLYGVLRDEGYAVDTVEHPAFAVQKVMEGAFDVLIVDSEPFGLSTEDAVRIIRSIRPDLPILCTGSNEHCEGALGVGSPLDMEAFKRAFHATGV